MTAGQAVVVMWINSDQNLWKNDEAAWVGNPALWVAFELWWAGKTRRDWDNIIPPHRHKVCHEIWMWEGKKWQTRRNGRRWSEKHVCLHWALLLPVTSIHFSSLCSQKKSVFLCVCVCVCVTRYSPKRFCILSTLFILSFIWTVLFSADHLMSCPGLSCTGEKCSSSQVMESWWSWAL